MLMNKRFLFDRLSGTHYTSTVQNGRTTEIDSDYGETEKTFKSIKWFQNRQERTLKRRTKNEPRLAVP